VQETAASGVPRRENLFIFPDFFLDALQSRAYLSVMKIQTDNIKSQSNKRLDLPGLLPDLNYLQFLFRLDLQARQIRPMRE